MSIGRSRDPFWTFAHGDRYAVSLGNVLMTGALREYHRNVATIYCAIFYRK